MIDRGGGVGEDAPKERRNTGMDYSVRAKRVDLECDVELDADSVTFPCEGLNLSASGIALATPARFAKETPVWVGFDSDHEQCRLLLPGVIVRAQERRHGYLWAIQFGELDDVLRDKLEQRIEFEQSIFSRPPPV